MARQDTGGARRRWVDAGIDLLAVAGAASLTYGVWMIYPPAAFIVGGAGSIASALMLARAVPPVRSVPPAPRT